MTSLVATVHVTLGYGTHQFQLRDHCYSRLPYAGPVIDSAIDQQVIVSSYDRMMFSDGIRTIIVVKS